MNLSLNIKKIFLVFAVMSVVAVAVPAYALKVQIFKSVDPDVEIATQVLRDKAVSQAFAQALFSESIRMIPEPLSSERSEALKKVFSQNYEKYISGYKDMDVKQEEGGVAVSIDVNVNRQSLRSALKKMGMFIPADAAVMADVQVSNEKYPLNEDQQLRQNAEIESLMALYAVNRVPAGGNGTVTVFSARHAGKNRWSGELSSEFGKWYASGPAMDVVWHNLWEKYYDSRQIDTVMNPRGVLFVTGWFNPEGVREFGKKLRSWDSAVQEVQLLNVKMEPTAVSACWSLEVSDQWVLRSNLNDYLPMRGLTFNLEGLEDKK